MIYVTSAYHHRYLLWIVYYRTLCTCSPATATLAWRVCANNGLCALCCSGRLIVDCRKSLDWGQGRAGRGVLSLPVVPANFIVHSSISVVPVNFIVHSSVSVVPVNFIVHSSIPVVLVNFIVHSSVSVVPAKFIVWQMLANLYNN